MSSRDPLLIGTLSVIVIALSLSLVSIYLLPEYYYQVHIYRNTNESAMIELLEDVEKLGPNSDCFSSINFTYVVNSGGGIIENISAWIDWVQSLKNHNGVAGRNISIPETTVPISDSMPKKIRLTYNGTILSSKVNYTNFLSFINETFLDSKGYVDATYLAFMNDTNGNYKAYTNFLNETNEKFDYAMIMVGLDTVYSSASTKPDFVITQHVDLLVSFGFLRDYKISFTRLVLIDIYGRILFFLSNDGNWQAPEF